MNGVVAYIMTVKIVINCVKMCFLVIVLYSVLECVTVMLHYSHLFLWPDIVYSMYMADPSLIIFFGYINIIKGHH